MFEIDAKLTMLMNKQYSKYHNHTKKPDSIYLGLRIDKAERIAHERFAVLRYVSKSTKHDLIADLMKNDIFIKRYYGYNYLLLIDRLCAKEIILWLEDNYENEKWFFLAGKTWTSLDYNNGEIEFRTQTSYDSERCDIFLFINDEEMMSLLKILFSNKISEIY